MLPRKHIIAELPRLPYNWNAYNVASSLAACSPFCLPSPIGLGLCTSVDPTDCCNYYFNDVCIPTCPSNTIPDANLHCGRSIINYFLWNRNQNILSPYSIPFRNPYLYIAYLPIHLGNLIHIHPRAVLTRIMFTLHRFDVVTLCQLPWLTILNHTSIVNRAFWLCIVKINTLCHWADGCIIVSLSWSR